MISDTLYGVAASLVCYNIFVDGLYPYHGSSDLYARYSTYDVCMYAFLIFVPFDRMVKTAYSMQQVPRIRGNFPLS